MRHSNDAVVQRRACQRHGLLAGDPLWTRRKQAAGPRPLTTCSPSPAESPHRQVMPWHAMLFRHRIMWPLALVVSCKDPREAEQVRVESTLHLESARQCVLDGWSGLQSTSDVVCKSQHLYC